VSLPVPICRLGYPQSQLKEIFSEDQFKRFIAWMRGQTFASCEGSEYVKYYVPNGCGPHGYVYYTHDVKRFLDGSPIVD
jgi:hypothetical protein